MRQANLPSHYFFALKKEYFYPMRLPVLTLAALLWAQTTHPNRAYVRISQAPFLHGVASRDPTQNSVVMWTRVTPPQNWTKLISP
jgi:phosphodiesterase/alkaline phosphatase D-like protein